MGAALEPPIVRNDATGRLRRSRRSSSYATVSGFEISTDRLIGLELQMEAFRRSAKDEAVTDLINSAAYEALAEKKIKEELQLLFGQVHDYKQFVQQIKNQIEVHLSLRYGQDDIVQNLRLASEEEASIYHAAQLMDDKLTAAGYLDNRDLINSPREQASFNLYSLVYKYMKIYRTAALKKDLTFERSGNNFAEISGNPRAIAIIPHSLIDNAVKYSPIGGEIKVEFQELTDRVVMRVRSQGPRIHDDEIERIFTLFHRGREAGGDGSGFGLAISKVIADEIGSPLSVVQGGTPIQLGGVAYYPTEFAVEFRRASKLSSPGDPR